MNKTVLNKDFNPSGTGLNNGNFIGLPYSYETANIILLPVPWDVTVSGDEGTAMAPASILNVSRQLDLFDVDIRDAWKLGIYMAPVNQNIMNERNNLRPKAFAHIDKIESGDINISSGELDKVNEGCAKLNSLIFSESKKVIEAGKICGVVGGDHSVSLGLVQALGDFYQSFGILQIDAHMDLRKSYQGFTWSHASAFYNILKEKSVSKLVQVAIRDFCEEEAEMIHAETGRVEVFFDHDLQEKKFNGVLWGVICEEVVAQLPENVYISVDLDGLDPKLCPNTGTPVPGGVDYGELLYLFRKVIQSGKKIIGFDVCEAGNDNWDANVAARIIYKLSNLAGRSQGFI